MEAEAMRSAVILAGGSGSRLGAEKSLMEFEGRPLIQWSVEHLLQVVDEVVVVARSQDQARLLGELIPGVKITCDSVTGFGPVAGLAAGMACAEGDYVFAIGCDLPFLNLGVVNTLFELILGIDHIQGKKVEEGFDAAVPVRPDGVMETLHAVYKREPMLKACLSAIERRERKIRAPLRDLRVRLVPVEILQSSDPQLLTFFNVNTGDELAEARRLWPNHGPRSNPRPDHSPEFRLNMSLQHSVNRINHSQEYGYLKQSPDRVP